MIVSAYNILISNVISVKKIIVAYKCLYNKWCAYIRMLKNITKKYKLDQFILYDISTILKRKEMPKSCKTVEISSKTCLF